jgi:hypothetical protein
VHRARAVDEDEREPVDKSLAAVDSGQVAGLQLSCGQANRSKKTAILTSNTQIDQKKNSWGRDGWNFREANLGTAKASQHATNLC